MCSGIDGFVGVFAKNMIPKVIDGCAIVNLHDFGQPGSHWVAFWKRGDVSLYFDSFGAAPPVDVVKALRPNEIVYNTSAIQDLRSEACGWYCVSFLKAMDDGVDYYDWLYQFDQTGGLENDQLIIY